jgi:hypothetical protein
VKGLLDSRSSFDYAHKHKPECPFRSMEKDIETMFLAVMLASMLVNLIHWRSRSGERFNYHARGWQGRVSEVLCLLLVISAVLTLFKVIPNIILIIITSGWMTHLQFHSIWQRHIRRKQVKQMC